MQPRAGMAYDLSGDGDTMLRSAFGIYYDQPLVGIFEQNSFTMPPIVNNVTFTNPTLANPASGPDADDDRRAHDHRVTAPTSRIRARCSGTSA